MPGSSNTPSRRGSRFLTLLSDAEYAALAPKLQLVDCKAKEVVGERGTAVNAIYFPCGAVFSVLACMEDGSAIEVGTIGNLQGQTELFTDDENDACLNYVQLNSSIDVLEMLAGYSTTSFLIVRQLADAAHSNDGITPYQFKMLMSRIATLEESKSRLC